MRKLWIWHFLRPPQDRGNPFTALLLKGGICSPLSMAITLNTCVKTTPNTFSATPPFFVWLKLDLPSPLLFRSPPPRSYDLSLTCLGTPGMSVLLLRMAGALDGGSPMSYANSKKWQCPLSLFLQFPCRF